MGSLGLTGAGVPVSPGAAGSQRGQEGALSASAATSAAHCSVPRAVPCGTHVLHSPRPGQATWHSLEHCPAEKQLGAGPAVPIGFWSSVSRFRDLQECRRTGKQPSGPHSCFSLLPQINLSSLKHAFLFPISDVSRDSDGICSRALGLGSVFQGVLPGQLATPLNLDGCPTAAGPCQAAAVGGGRGSRGISFLCAPVWDLE